MSFLPSFPNAKELRIENTFKNSCEQRKEKKKNGKSFISAINFQLKHIESSARSFLNDMSNIYSRYNDNIQSFFFFFAFDKHFFFLSCLTKRKSIFCLMILHVRCFWKKKVLVKLCFALSKLYCLLPISFLLPLCCSLK